MSSTTVAIAGFTGKMARLITSSLLANYPETKIIGICRFPEKVSEELRTSPNIEVFPANSSDKQALRRALKGASVCICCYLGDDDLMINGQKILIDACIDEGVPRYIASDWSVDYRSLAFGELPPKDPMKHVQMYLDEKEKDGRIKGVHVLNGGFTEFYFAPFTGVFNAEGPTFKHWGSGDEGLDTTMWEDAAAFTAHAAMDPSATGFLTCEWLLQD